MGPYRSIAFSMIAVMENQSLELKIARQMQNTRKSSIGDCGLSLYEN